MWKEWREALKETFINHLDAHNRLTVPLGDWLETSATLEWKWWFSISTKRVYTRNTANMGTASSIIVSPHRFSRFTMPTPHLVHVPADARPVTVELRGTHTFAHCRSSPATPLHPYPIYPQSLSDSLLGLPVELQWIVRDFFPPDQGEAIAEGLRSGLAIAVTDGSYKDGIKILYR